MRSLFTVIAVCASSTFFCSIGGAATVKVSPFQSTFCGSLLEGSSNQLLFSDLNSNQLIEIIRNKKLSIEQRDQAAKALLSIADIQVANHIRDFLNKSSDRDLSEGDGTYYYSKSQLIFSLDKILKKFDLYSNWSFVDSYMWGSGYPMAVRVVDEAGGVKDYDEVPVESVSRTRTGGMDSYVFRVKVDGQAYEFKPYRYFSGGLRRDGVPYVIPINDRRAKGTYDRPILIFSKNPNGNTSFSVGGLFDVVENDSHKFVVVDSAEKLSQSLQGWASVAEADRQSQTESENGFRSWLQKILGH